jgi:D-amino-acid dehydrogenase
MTPSTVPITGKSNKFDNLYFNTGHGMLGWTLALGSAKKIAESIV